MSRESCPTWFMLIALSFSLGAAIVRADPGKPPTEREKVEFFETRVVPILKANCFRCHGGEAKIKGSLRLTSRAGLLEGGDTGPAVSLTDPGESLLLDAVNYRTYKMPPKGKLSPKDIETLTRWVELGVPWSAGDDTKFAATARHGPPAVNTETMGFWSFRPVQRPAVSRISGAANPIDAFVMARLGAADLSPAPPAGKAALMRRVYYDLIGLPPSPEEVQAFLADPSPHAYERVLDRLLASPHYGEHWGRHWLDLVRYAETNSYERDGEKPAAWRYRDYVIRSFNADKPYDQFIREQLAGDELDHVTSDSLIATGYYRLGIWDDEPVDAEQALYDDLDDIVTTTGQVFLGLTVNCARCHDHKLDPIPQRDYYRMLAFFGGLTRFGERNADSVQRNSLRPIGTPEATRQQAAEIEDNKQKLRETTRRIAEIEAVVQNDLTPLEKEEYREIAARPAILKARVPRLLSDRKFQEYVALTEERARLKSSSSSVLNMALCVTETGPKPRDTYVLVRGNPHGRGPQVEPGFLSVLAPPDPVFAMPRPDAKTCGRRLALAEWIASKSNPLTARVMVNRIWQYHFGRGLVRSANNFGLQGTPPTHPELLDWLADEFVAGGWRLKPLHKQILMSNTYRLSSQAAETALAKDPENDLLARFDMRRLAAEEIRDSILAVNGSLNRRKLYGPSIYPIMPKEVLAGQSRPGDGWGNSSPEDRARRSVYIHVKRSLVPPILSSFDSADTDASCPVRFTTTQPTQALGMLNSDFLNEQAEVFADFVRREARSGVRQQVTLALRHALQRDPSEAEVGRGMQLIESLQREHRVDSHAALKRFCLVVLNLNEFMYLD